MAAAIPKLYYFNGPGRANLTRLAFAAGGVHYTNTKVDFEEWAKVKAYLAHALRLPAPPAAGDDGLDANGRIRVPEPLPPRRVPRATGDACKHAGTALAFSRVTGNQPHDAARSGMAVAQVHGRQPGY